MKSKLINVISIFLMAFLLSGCDEGIDVAMITDMGTIEDGSFNQGAYEGAKLYADENSKEFNLYEPKEATTDCYMKTIKAAVKDGADVIVCPGVLFEEAVYKAQKKYSDVKFILIDGEPHDKQYSDYTILDNTFPIMFAEEQAGFLAGYSAVRDGNTELGFLGGIDLDSVMRYGYGFVQGADYAAIEMGININIRYAYTNTFLQSEEVKKLATSWYQDGTQVIFACGGLMGQSVMSAAEVSDGKVIGVDIDQSKQSDTVITSAKKMISNAVYLSIRNCYSETAKGGTVYNMDAANNGIALEMENSRFDRFSANEYDPIYSMLASRTIEPYYSDSYGTTYDLELVNTTVDYMEL